MKLHIYVEVEFFANGTHVHSLWRVITLQLVDGTATILDINYVDFLQFQRYFIPQAELEEAFLYIIRKPIYFSIDFSYRLKT